MLQFSKYVLSASSSPHTAVGPGIPVPDEMGTLSLARRPGEAGATVETFLLCKSVAVGHVAFEHLKCGIEFLILFNELI